MIHDWREFTLRIIISAPIGKVFEAWTSIDGLGRWFVKAAFQPTGVANEGTRYRWEWAEGTVETGEFTAVNGEESIAFTFGDESGVTVSLATLGDRTLLQLVQRNSHSDERARMDYWMDCHQGWSFYMANLKSVLEGGLDLREFEEPAVRYLVNV